jgi:hypothetical protein
MVHRSCRKQTRVKEHSKAAKAFSFTSYFQNMTEKFRGFIGIVDLQVAHLKQLHLEGEDRWPAAYYRRMKA